MAKDKGKDKKPKKKKAADPDNPEWPTISVSRHPRAQRSIHRSKAWAALIGFGLVGYLSHQAGVAPFEVGVRALISGMVLYFAVWAASLALWKRLVLHEAKTEAERRRDQRAAAVQRLMQEHAAGAAKNDEEAIA